MFRAAILDHLVPGASLRALRRVLTYSELPCCTR